MPEWVELIVSILSGLVVVIPLVVKLVSMTIAYVKEKNWNQIIVMVTEYMADAEKLFKVGSDKKAWVLETLKTSAEVSNFDLTEESLLKISDLIDKMCTLSKQINKETKEEVSK